MTTRQIRFTSLIVALLTAATIASAQTLSTDRAFRLGEDDPGAIAGNATNPVTVPTGAGSETLPPANRFGNPLYGVGAQGLGIGMTTAAGDNGHSAADALIFTNNLFFIEAWVRNTGDFTGRGIIAFIGDPAANGFGLIRQDDEYGMLFGGRGAYRMFITPSVGAWMHLAFVRQFGLTTFYLNGVAHAYAGDGPFEMVAGTAQTYIGGIPGTGNSFTGDIDHVRVGEFNFFDPSMLNVRKLNVGLTHATGGTVTADVGPINCGPVCNAPYPKNAVITLTATPAQSVTFLGWDGAGCSGTGTCVVTLANTEFVLAQFSGDGPPTITSADNATFTVHEPGTFTATTDIPATFTTTGPLPTGVTLGTDGVLSGTPATGTVGTWPFTMTATTVAGSGNQPFTLTILKHAQVITPQHATPGHTWLGYSFPAYALGGGSTSPVVLTAGPPAICATTGSGVDIAITNLGVGWCDVTYTQAGDADYDAAPAIQYSYEVYNPYVTLRYRMGEDNPGAAIGAFTGLLQAMPPANAPLNTYLSPTFAAGANGPGFSVEYERLQVNVGDGLARPGAPFDFVDNFMVQAWARSFGNVGLGDSIVAYIGYTPFGGYGIFRTPDGKYKGLFGGIETIDPNVAATDEWKHLALVRVNGVTTFYENGIARATTNTTPASPNADFRVHTYIGFNVYSPGGFSGRIDDVEFRTFAPSSFSLAELNVRTLTVQKAGPITVGATVTSDYGPINCGATCTAPYPKDTMVTLTVNATFPYLFTGWSGGGCSGTGTCIVNVNDSPTVTANIGYGGPVSTYRLGEDDPGATIGNIGNATTNTQESGMSLARVASPTYAAGVHGAGTGLNVTAGSGYSQPGWVQGGNDNVGVEAWVKSDGGTVANGFVAYTGHGGNAGFGLILAEGRHMVLFGGVEVFDPGLPASNEWMHVAFVRINGVTRMYRNGVAVPGENFATPNYPGNNVNSATTIGTGFSGTMDEVRFFNFAPPFDLAQLKVRRLDVARDGSGTGTVTSNVGPIACGAACTAPYLPNTTVTLTATPDAGSNFAGWSGGSCSGTGTCIVTLSSSQTVTATFGTAAPPASPRSGFNGDASSDVLWRNASTGHVYQWQMNGPAISAQSYMPSVPANWMVAGVGDTNGDGAADVFWREAGGLNYLWIVTGFGITSQGYMPSVPNPWIVAGLGDTNGDGKADVVWRNPSTGQNYLWILNGQSITSQGYLPGVAGSDWEIVGIADYNGDAKADVLWRNKATGQNYLWLLNGLTVSSQGFLPGVAGSDWEIVASPDANGDGKADVLWRNKSTGQNYLWLVNGLSVASQGFLPSVADANWKVAGFGDYNADGKGDVLWRNAATGQNYLWTLNGISVTSQAFLPNVIGANWMPVK